MTQVHFVGLFSKRLSCSGFKCKIWFIKLFYIVALNSHMLLRNINLLALNYFKLKAIKAGYSIDEGKALICIPSPIPGLKL